MLENFLLANDCRHIVGILFALARTRNVTDASDDGTDPQDIYAGDSFAFISSRFSSQSCFRIRVYLFNAATTTTFTEVGGKANITPLQHRKRIWLKCTSI